MEQNKIIIYQTEDGQTQIDVRMENDTVWLTQAQMAELFDSSRTNIVEHIQHIYEDKELDDISTCRKFRQVRLEGKRKVTKNHSFSDGNKRIAATLFLWFLNNNGILYRSDGINVSPITH